MTRLTAALLALAAAAACASCAEPAPPGVDPIAYDRAFHECKEWARVYGGYGYGERPVFATVCTHASSCTTRAGNLSTLAWRRKASRRRPIERQRLAALQASASAAP